VALPRAWWRARRCCLQLCSGTIGKSFAFAAALAPHGRCARRGIAAIAARAPRLSHRAQALRNALVRACAFWLHWCAHAMMVRFHHSQAKFTAQNSSDLLCAMRLHALWRLPAYERDPHPLLVSQGGSGFAFPSRSSAYGWLCSCWLLCCSISVPRGSWPSALPGQGPAGSGSALPSADQHSPGSINRPHPGLFRAWPCGGSKPSTRGSSCALPWRRSAYGKQHLCCWLC